MWCANIGSNMNKPTSAASAPAILNLSLIHICYSYLEENLDKIQGETINGVAPTFENIADGKYPVSRPLFVYVKKAHIGVIPGIKEFIAEFTSEKAVGDDGYLSKKGLIPLPAAKRKQAAADANSLKTMTP